MTIRHRTRSFRNLARVLSAVVIGVGVVWGGHVAWEAWSNRDMPACSWPMRVRGTVTGAQAGLVRCYLRALAGHSTVGLQSVALNVPPTSVKGSDFAYSADARSGLATATFTPNPFDDDAAILVIKYANGVVENTGLINEQAMGGGDYWRIAID